MIDIIIYNVCDYFGLKMTDLHRKTNKREIVQARQIAHYFARHKTNKSFADIGKDIGNKDHSTVLWSCKTIENLIMYDKKIALQIETIDSNIELTNKNNILVKFTKWLKSNLEYINYDEIEILEEYKKQLNN